MSVLEECTEAILLQKIGKKLSSFMLININILWLKNNQIVMDLRGVDSESNYWQEKHLNINCVKISISVPGFYVPKSTWSWGNYSIP